MKKFISFLSMQMEGFIHYREVAGNWNGSYEENLKWTSTFRMHPERKSGHICLMLLLILNWLFFS